MIGDGDGRRRGQPVGMRAAAASRATSSRSNQRASSSSVRSMTMSCDSASRVAADHQRGGERPGLRGEIAHAAADDAGFLEGFPPHRILDRFARLDEAGEARPHAALETVRAAEQAAVAGDRQHDHDRIGAREMLGLAGRAIAPPAGLRPRWSRRRNSSRSGGAHASAAAPCLRRAAADDRASTRPLHRDRAQIGDDEVVAGLERLGGGGVERHREARRVRRSGRERPLPRCGRARAPRPA